MAEWNETQNGQDTNNAWEYWVNIYYNEMPGFAVSLDNLANQPIGG